MGASGEWSRFLPKADDAAEVKAGIYPLVMTNIAIENGHL